MSAEQDLGSAPRSTLALPLVLPEKHPYVRQLHKLLNADRADLVGSTYICGYGQDVDVLLQVSNIDCALDLLRGEGFEVDETAEYGDRDEFVSAKNGPINALLVSSDAFYLKWLQAAEVCRAVYLKQGFIDKPTRVAIHQVIMDGYAACAT